MWRHLLAATLLKQLTLLLLKVIIDFFRLMAGNIILHKVFTAIM